MTSAQKRELKKQFPNLSKEELKLKIKQLDIENNKSRQEPIPSPLELLKRERSIDSAELESIANETIKVMTNLAKRLEIVPFETSKVEVGSKNTEDIPNVLENTALEMFNNTDEELIGEMFFYKDGFVHSFSLEDYANEFYSKVNETTELAGIPLLDFHPIIGQQIVRKYALNDYMIGTEAYLHDGENGRNGKESLILYYRSSFKEREFEIHYEIKSEGTPRKLGERIFKNHSNDPASFYRFDYTDFFSERDIISEILGHYRCEEVLVNLSDHIHFEVEDPNHIGMVFALRKKWVQN